DLFTSDGLLDDVRRSINDTEMSKRKFREVASISGLLFQGYPGKQVSFKHLQTSAQLLYDVFTEYEPTNLLLTQASEEVLQYQLEQSRLQRAMERIQRQAISIQHPQRPTPFSFPIIADRLRAKLTSEKLEDRIAKMQVQLEIFANNPKE
ncbi:MAG: DNA ligase-associated DEXH box helicase, partial [Bacteroidota bacterium]